MNDLPDRSSINGSPHPSPQDLGHGYFPPADTRHSGF